MNYNIKSSKYSGRVLPDFEAQRWIDFIENSEKGSLETTQNKFISAYGFLKSSGKKAIFYIFWVI